MQFLRKSGILKWTNACTCYFWTVDLQGLGPLDGGEADLPWSSRNDTLQQFVLLGTRKDQIYKIQQQEKHG